MCKNLCRYALTFKFSLFSHLSKYLSFFILSITQGYSAVALIQAVLTSILPPFSIHISVR